MVWAGLSWFELARQCWTSSNSQYCKNQICSTPSKSTFKEQLISKHLCPCRCCVSVLDFIPLSTRYCSMLSYCLDLLRVGLGGGDGFGFFPGWPIVGLRFPWWAHSWLLSACRTTDINEQSKNHISLWIGLGVIQSHPLHKTCYTTPPQGP